MQSFKYDLPSLRHRAEARRANGSRGWLAVAAALAVLGVGLWNTLPRGANAGPIDATYASPAAAEVAHAAAVEREAEGALRRGDYANAIRGFDRALRLDPARVSAFQRGQDARTMAPGRPTAGLAELLPEPGARMTFLLARAAQEATRRPAAALDDCNQARTLAPEDPRVLRAWASLQEKLGDPAEAITAYEQALRVQPDDLPLAAGLIALRLRTGDLERGEAEARTSLLPHASKTRDPLVHGTLLKAWIEQGVAPDALRAQHLSAAPQLSEAERRLFAARAYLAHYKDNPGWNRDAYTLALGEAEAVLKPREGEPSADQRREALEIMLEVHATRASRLTARSETDAARAALDKALALRSRLAGHAHRFADLYAQRARLTPAGEAANKLMDAAIALNPEHPVRHELERVYANLGVSLQGANKVAQSLKPLARAVALEPEDAGVAARYYLALRSADVSDPLGAVAKARGHKDRGEALAIVLAGLVHDGKHEAASNLYEAHAKGLPAHARALARAELLAGRGERLEARKYYMQGLAKGQDPAPWRRLAALDRALAGKAQASRKAALRRVREDYRHAVALGGDRKDRACLLGAAREVVELELAAGEMTVARRDALEALRLDPRNPALGQALATALARMGKTDEAIVACRLALTGLTGQADPMHAPLRERLGGLYKAQKRYAEAIAEYKRGLAHPEAASPKQAADLCYGLATTLAANGDREEALNAIRQYVFWSQHDPHQGVRVAQLQALELDLSTRPRS